MSDAKIYPVGESLIQAVLLCAVFRQDVPGRRGDSTSRAGHLIQLMIEGKTDHEISGRQYALEGGNLVWYHEDELMRIRCREAPWSLYSLNFLAPALEPPPFEKRVGRMSGRIFVLFEELLTVWRDTEASPVLRRLRVHAGVGRLLAAVWEELDAGSGQKFRMETAAKLWWELESRLRHDLSAPISLERMEELTGRSSATIARACREAVGMPPMKRVKNIRMSFARQLVLRSTLPLTEIAERVGYPRPHEFSRDYHRHYGFPPREDRRQNGG